VGVWLAGIRGRVYGIFNFLFLDSFKAGFADVADVGCVVVAEFAGVCVIVFK
jgi:hypothetical protein